MCFNPITIRQGKHDEATVPCSRCPECIGRRISAWSFRLMKEDQVSSSAWFITLTYANEYLQRTPNGFQNLSKRDLQLFFKRLRKLNKNKIKYYACGEYGSNTRRPHYHIILFNADVSTIERAWSIQGKSIGTIHYGSVTGASVGYTLKYLCKPKRHKLHERDDRMFEFALMSKSLGANYLTEAMRKWHENDLENRMYCVLEGGQKISMPRYYKDKIYTEKMRQIVSEAQLQRIEREQHEERVRYMDDEMYWRNKHEAVKAAYKKMYYQSSVGKQIV
nr:MAG: replication initiator protein [Microvirus sp.]